MRLSVIITTFNRPDLLREAMASVLAQNFKDFELIVVDDASPGNETERVVLSFTDPRVRYVKNPTNLGSAKSLNIGLRQAQGEYVAILDDDDVWLSPEKLKRQVEFLDSHQEHVLVGTNMVIVETGSGQELGRSNYPFGDDELRKIIFRRNPFAHSSVVYRRRAALAVGGYDESLPRGKDYDLWFKLLRRGKAAVLPDYFLKYREGGFENKNIVEQRYEDAGRTLAVMARYRRDFSGSFLPYFRQRCRYLIFRILRHLPSFYQLIKRVKRIILPLKTSHAHGINRRERI